MPDYTMKNYYNRGQYVEAIEYASDPAVRSGFSMWDYIFLSKCLYKLKRYSDCLKVYEEFQGRFPGSDQLDDTMGWCRYYVYIKSFDFETENRFHFLEQVDYVLSHSSDSSYSPRIRTVMFATDAIFGQKLAVNPDYELADRYLSLINPSMLELKEHEHIVDGKAFKAESDREKWYRQKTKALYETGQYEKCLKLIDAAFAQDDPLNGIDRFHNNNDHWLNYKRAQCYYELGDYEFAAKIINAILSRFTHWCFYQLLFKISAEKGKTEDAIRYGAQCATFDRDHKPRVNFYEEYAAYLAANGYPREAALHYKLVELIREEEGWKGIRLPEEFSYPQDIIEMDKKEVIRNLVSFWNQEKEQGIEFHEGTIARILPNGKSGFIRDDTGKSYYFNIRDFTRRVSELQEGERVRYALTERLDKSKNEMKLNAVQISFIR